MIQNKEFKNRSIGLKIIHYLKFPTIFSAASNINSLHDTADTAHLQVVFLLGRNEVKLWLNKIQRIGW